MIINTVCVCGDSFTTGTGLNPEDCFEKSFGGLLAEKLELPLKMFARNGACNFVIYLQVMEVIEQYHKKLHKPFVVIGTTSSSRTSFPISPDFIYGEIKLGDVDYKNYKPYSDISEYQRDVCFPTNLEPYILTETIMNVFNDDHDIPARFSKDKLNRFMIKSKREALKKYYEELYDERIKRIYDEALMLKMSAELKKHQIPHILLYEKPILLDEKHFMLHDWYELVKNYPDKLNTGHVDYRAHEIVFENLNEHYLKYYKNLSNRVI